MSEQYENIDPEEIKKQIQLEVEAQAAALANMNELAAQMEEMQRQFSKISRAKNELERQNKDRAQTLRELEKTLEQANRFAAIRDEKDRLQKEFAEASRKYDELTATAKWREFAFDHQIQGAKIMAVAKRGIVADKRGLGKTLTSLVWADMVEAKRILIIAPNDVVSQFEEEIRQWAPARNIWTLAGMPKAQRDFVYPLMTQQDEFIATINYEAWRKDKTVIDDLVIAGLDTIVCDEAHRIKSSEKITARGVFQIAYRPNHCANCNLTANFHGAWWDKEKSRLVDRYDGICPSCGGVLTNTVANVLCMTGTPILNKPQELFSMLHLVNRYNFPNERSFLKDYCYSPRPNRWAFKYGGADRLMKFMSSFFIQRTRDDAGIHVPPPAITVHNIEKDIKKYEKQYMAEHTIKNLATMILEDGTRKDIFFVLEMILRQRQAMTWPAGINIVIKDPETQEIIQTLQFDVEESQKIDEAHEFLMELLEEEERVIVFSQFKAPLYEMFDRVEAAGYHPVMATGDQTKEHKERVREDFDLKTYTANPDRAPRWDVAFATYKAFGTGINLNAARHIIILDDEWNPGMEDQAIGRIDRMNSVDQANVHIFRVEDSVDDWMAGLLEEKRNITGEFDESFDARKAMIGFFTDKDVDNDS